MATKRSGSLLPWLGIALIIVLLDQLTKALIVRSFQLGDRHTVNAFFNVVRVHNVGAAFSFLANASGWQGRFFTVIAVGAVLLILWLLARHGAQSLFSLALALILGGALGNLVDRLLYGHVIDFLLFHYRDLAWPAFNVADSAIVGGAALLVFDELRRVRRAG